MFCQFCGTAMEAESKFCPNCGRSQTAEPPPAGENIPSTPPLQPQIPAAPPYQARPITAQTGKWLSEGWNLLSGEVLIIAFAGILGAVVANITFGILSGAMAIGGFILLTRKLQRNSVDIGDLFKGLKFWLDGLLATIVIAAFVAIGSLLCIIPGLVAAVAFMFTFHFIYDKRMSFWDAMMASHEVVKKDYFGYTLFLISLFLINFLGVCACIVGVFVTIPWGHAAVTVAYRDAVGLDPTSSVLNT